MPSFPGALFFTADASWFCLVVYRKYWIDSFAVEAVAKVARQGRLRSEFVLRFSGAGGERSSGCGRFGERRLPLQKDHRRGMHMHVRRHGAIAGSSMVHLNVAGRLTDAFGFGLARQGGPTCRSTTAKCRSPCP